MRKRKPSVVRRQPPLLLLMMGALAIGLVAQQICTITDIGDGRTETYWAGQYNGHDWEVRYETDANGNVTGAQVDDKYHHDTWWITFYDGSGDIITSSEHEEHHFMWGGYSNLPEHLSSGPESDWDQDIPDPMYVVYMATSFCNG